MRPRWLNLARPASLPVWRPISLPISLPILLLGALTLPAAGCFDVHDTRDDAGLAVDARSTPDANLVCRAIDASEVRLPRVLYDDQALVVTAHAPGSGCGCQPSLGPLSPASPSVSLQLCSCCDECECIDSAYEASVVGGTWPLGAHTVSTSAGPRPLLVTTRELTWPLEPTGLRVETPSDAVVASGPTVHWATISTMISVCCVEPVAAVDEGVGPAGEVVLSLANAVQEDCACLGEPTLLEVAWPLVDLRSGEHVVRAGAFEARVRVP